MRLGFNWWAVPGLVLFVAYSAAAQEPANSFEQLQFKLNTGDKVQVIDKTGHRTQGQVYSISPNLLRVRINGDTRSFGEEAVQRVSRGGHVSLLKGALWGGLAGGVALPLILCRGEESCSGEPVAVGALFAGIGAGAGTVAAALMSKTTTVFEARGKVSVHVVPVFTQRHKGAQLFVSIHRGRD
jgi:hypothetical protein